MLTTGQETEFLVLGDIEKPDPVTAAVPVTGELPVFVKVTDKVEAVFSVTLPNDKLEGCGRQSRDCSWERIQV